MEGFCGDTTTMHPLTRRGYYYYYTHTHTPTAHTSHDTTQHTTATTNMVMDHSLWSAKTL